MTEQKEVSLSFAVVMLVVVTFWALSLPAVAAQTDLVESAPRLMVTGASVSDSPHLRVAEEARHWPPAQPPVWRPLVSIFSDAHAAVEYDLRTGETMEVPLRELSGTNAASTPAFEGLLPPGLTADTVLGVDDRVRVGDTTAYPWRTLCKLFITAADGSGWIGSGTIIGRADGNGFHVLTAGHVVYMHDRGGWVSRIEVIPGYDDGYMPFYQAYATYFRTYTGWTTSAMPEHDWAVVTLDRRIGNYTGWLGRITRSTSHRIYTTTLNSGGYPGDLCFGNCLYFDSDTGLRAEELRHWYYMDTAGGQSGMPIWLYTTSGDDPPPGRYITTVHAYGSDGTANSGTRLNSDKFDRIISWIDSDSLPADRPDLVDDGPSYSSFGPISVTPGTSSFSVQCRVRNVGTASAGTFKVNFYASANTTISSSDYFLAQATVQAIAPFNYATAFWSGVFPASIPAGTYYVGWIIDGEGVVAEFNEFNNTAYRSSPGLSVGSAGTPDIRINPSSLTFAGTSSAADEVNHDQIVQDPPASLTNQVMTAREKLVDEQQIMRNFAESPRVRVIVNVTLPAEAQRAVDFRSEAAMKMWQSTVSGLQEKALESLPVDHVRPRVRFQNIAAFSAEVTQEGLQALQANPRVASIEPVYVLEPHLAQGIPLIRATTYRSTYNGAGVAIAICDTGVDYRHPRLGGGGFPNSKVLGGYDFGDNDSDPAADGHAHGTACAGIAAGDFGSVGEYIGGVAPAAKIYALKISPGATGSATSDAMVAAWDWCVTHKNDDPNNPILVISTSFGGGRYFSYGDNAVPAMTAAANNAVAAGITVLASSGNNGFCDSLAWPACISSVISVGAVYDAGFGSYSPCVDAASCANKIPTPGCFSGYYVDDVTAPDKVTAYCNTASFLSILAPGNRCYTLDISGAGGYSSSDYMEAFGGTSAACPYVAGAVACLQAAAKARTGNYLTQHDVRSRLLSHGDNIADSRVAITKPRLNLDRAIESLGPPAQSFRVFNDGNQILAINAIVPETLAPWIRVTPSGSFNVAAGGYQDVAVAIDLALAPPEPTSTRLLVRSNDPDETPYPNAVYVNVTQSPPNDNFANRIAVHGSSASVTGSNRGASQEYGEPNHGGNPGGKSVWWSWTASASGKVSVTTEGSSFDTLLGVYTGTAVSSLTLIGDNDDSGQVLTSAVAFQASVGTTYHIAVDGYNGASGAIRLNLQAMPRLRIASLQRLPDGSCRMWIACADGTPITPSRIQAIDVCASTAVGQPMAGWSQLTGTLSAANGMVWIDDPAARNLPMRFYCIRERP